ncbi:MAG TPA: glycosyltransferase, partial [Chthoniobacterales bacterium]|nr:glycosyltransferase [Chthoniobacterales bacterium]
MKKSSLTVIVPVFNGADFLREALQSIRRLAQPQEIIVIDDGSTDSTAMVANSCPGVIYVRQENSGPAAARNRGLEIASGNLLAFLDADDIWNEGHPDTGIDYLRCHPDVDLVLGQVEYRFGLNGHDVQTSRQPFHSFQLGAAIVRRGLFSSVGCFNPEMRYGEDVDWFLRARERGAAFAMLPGTALYYRLHAGNQPRIYRNSRVGLLDAFHRSLERRRPAQTPPASARTQPGLISIVIPVFNGEQFVAHAIQSVIRQDYRPIELIVVDDGSIDRTRDLVRRRFPQVRLVEQSHGGAGVARNTGVRASAGE